MSVNRAILVGNVGKDPELRNMGNGKTMAAFSLATSERWSKDGEKKERTTWHNVAVFAEPLVRLAEHYIKKGSRLYVEGKIATRNYEKDGQDRYVTEIVVDGFQAQIVLLDKSEGGNRPPPPGGADEYGSTSTRGGAPAGGFGTMDDDIPFQAEVR